MRRLPTVVCPLFSTASVSGRQIKSRPVGIDDFRVVREAARYEAFGFGLTESLEGPCGCDMTLSSKEDGSDGEILSRKFPCGPDKQLASDFPEEFRGKMRPEETADPQTGIRRQAERPRVGSYPSGADSMKTLRGGIPDTGRFAPRLELRGATSGKGDRRLFECRTRPFGNDSCVPGMFIPPGFYGAMSFGAKAGSFRFCGGYEIAPDPSRETDGNIPAFM